MLSDQPVPYLHFSLVLYILEEITTSLIKQVSFPTPKMH